MWPLKTGFTVIHIYSMSCCFVLCTTFLPHFYPVYLQHSSSKHLFSISDETSLNPDRLASSEAS